MIKRHYWTEEEKDYIRVRYRRGKDSINRFVREFGVTPSSIRQLIGRLGLVKNSRLWKHREEVFLRENFDKLPTTNIARILGKTEGAIRHKAHRLRISKFERDGWFTMKEACNILGVTQSWLMKRLNNGFKFDMRSFDPNRIPKQGDNIPWYISEKSLKEFIQRYPTELVGHNVDIVTMVEILAGIKADNREWRDENA